MKGLGFRVLFRFPCAPPALPLPYFAFLSKGSFKGCFQGSFKGALKETLWAPEERRISALIIVVLVAVVLLMHNRFGVIFHRSQVYVGFWHLTP